MFIRQRPRGGSQRILLVSAPSDQAEALEPAPRPSILAATNAVEICATVRVLDERLPPFVSIIPSARLGRRRSNYVNRLADFEDMEVVHTYHFTANQAVIFIKTFTPGIRSDR